MSSEPESSREANPMAGLRILAANRACLLASIRRFLDSNGFLEVETPVRIPVPALETYIDAEQSGSMYLRTSPEFHMKRLVCGGLNRIYQIGSCFRAGESGRFHSPEYTMLEWYRTDSGYLDALDDTKALLKSISTDMLSMSDLNPERCREIAATESWVEISVKDAFEEFAGWNPCLDYSQERFDTDLVDKVEPALPVNRPVILRDYPGQACAFARINANTATSERWELYLGGMEIANAFSELTECDEYRRRMELSAIQRKDSGREPYEIDKDFLDDISGNGLPVSSGVAMGVDRLYMYLAGLRDIGCARLFDSRPVR